MKSIKLSKHHAAKPIEWEIDKSGCWICVSHICGSKSNHRPQVTYGGTRKRLISRVMYELYKGKIPKGKYLLHSCDNRLCIRPSHLRPGSHADNMADKVLRGRTAKNNTFNAKLSPKDIKAIRKMLNSGLSQQAISTKFKVSQTCISDINTEKTWKQ